MPTYVNRRTGEVVELPYDEHPDVLARLSARLDAEGFEEQGPPLPPEMVHQDQGPPLPPEIAERERRRAEYEARLDWKAEQLRRQRPQSGGIIDRLAASISSDPADDARPIVLDVEPTPEHEVLARSYAEKEAQEIIDAQEKKPRTLEEAARAQQEAEHERARAALSRPGFLGGERR